MTQVADQLTQILGPPRSAPAVCGFGDCQDDDKDALTQTTMWEFDPATRPEVLEKVRVFPGLADGGQHPPAIGVTPGHQVSRCCGVLEAGAYC